MNILKKLPLGEYEFAPNEWLAFRDIFVSLRLVDGLLDNPSFLTTVTLNAEERPDVVAHRLYDNPFLWWTLLLVNHIIDPNDWIKNHRVLEREVAAIHGNPNATSHFVDGRGERFDPRGNRWQVERSPFGTTNATPEVGFPVSFYQEAERLNEQRRIIRAIRKEYMNDFLVDAERKLRGHYGE